MASGASRSRCDCSRWKNAQRLQKKEDPAVHLLSVLTHKEGVVIAQKSVDKKTNEITEFQNLLHPLDLKGKVVTADALHTQVAHAKYVKEEKGADYFFTVKGNQGTLLKAIEDIDDEDFNPEHTTLDKGHGRIEVRKIQTSTALNDYITFPYAAQVCRIHRITYNLDGTYLREETAYGVTSLTEQKADSSRLLLLNRGHWCIENRLHWVRDVSFDEDRSQVRMGNGPQVMATLCNLAISLFRLNGVTNIAQALRSCGRKAERSLAYMGI